MLFMYKSRDKVFFGKLKPEAKIPTKKDEDAGYDIYACFEQDEVVIPPHTTVMIPTGLVSYFTSEYVGVLKERGSTGSIGIAQRCGIIDSGYRGEWFVPLTNTNDYKIIISKNEQAVKGYAEPDNEDKIAYLVYPYDKAICQCIFVEVPKFDVVEVPAEEIMSIESVRGQGKLGSSGK